MLEPSDSQHAADLTEWRNALAAAVVAAGLGYALVWGWDRLRFWWWDPVAAAHRALDQAGREAPSDG